MIQIVKSDVWSKSYRKFQFWRCRFFVNDLGFDTITILICIATDPIHLFIMFAFFSIYLFFIHYFKTIDECKVFGGDTGFCSFFQHDQFFNLITNTVVILEGLLYFEFLMISLTIVSVLKMTFFRNSIRSDQLN